MLESFKFLLVFQKHEKLGIISLFSQLHKNLISSFAFLSLKSNFSSFFTILRILSPHLDHIIAAIDYILGKRIFARNKNTSTATLKTILNFQVEQQSY